MPTTVGGLWLLLVAATSAVSAPATRAAAPIEALVARRVPQISPFLELRLLPRTLPDDTHELFSIGNSSSGPRNISVSASSPSACNTRRK